MTTSFKVFEHVIPGQHIREYPHSTRPGRQEHTLYLAVKQYVPVLTPSPAPDHAVTIIGMHGNGFPKEIYEPFYEDLCSALHAQGIVIKAIWLTDVSNQGASGVINENVQGDKTNWFDRSRDVLHMVNHFRDQMTRPIIGIAHSFGCAQMVQLSLLHPRLLSTLVLIEPVILSPKTIQGGGPNPALQSSFRRDLWPSREVAQQNLARGFSTWDPRTLSLYVKYGLRPLPTSLYPETQAALADLSAQEQKKKERKLREQQQKVESSSIPSVPPPQLLSHHVFRDNGQTQKQNHDHPSQLQPSPVTLTTSKHQEAWTYAQINFEPANSDTDRVLRPDMTAEFGLPHLVVRPETWHALNNLPYVRPSILWVYGGSSPLSPRPAREEKLRLTGTAMGGSGGHVTPPPTNQNDLTGRFPTSSSNESEILNVTRLHPSSRVEAHVIPNQGHLLPFERAALPELVHGACTPWITHWFRNWYLPDERVVAGYKGRHSDEAGMRMSREWLEVVRLPVDTPRPGSEPAQGEGPGGIKGKL